MAKKTLSENQKLAGKLKASTKAVSKTKQPKKCPTCGMAMKY